MAESSYQDDGLGTVPGDAPGHHLEAEKSTEDAPQEVSQKLTLTRQISPTLRYSDCFDY
jgi:hypothetical protein